MEAILNDPAALAALQAALAQPVNAQGTAAAQPDHLSLEMTNLAGPAQQAGEIQPADEQQVEEDIETGGGTGTCPAGGSDAGSSSSGSAGYASVGSQVIGGGPCR